MIRTMVPEAPLEQTEHGEGARALRLIVAAA
jgi:hypothetical protein